MGSDAIASLLRFAACFCGKLVGKWKIQNYYLTRLKNNMVSIKFYGCSEGDDVTSGSRVKLKRASTMNDRKIFPYGRIVLILVQEVGTGYFN